MQIPQFGAKFILTDLAPGQATQDFERVMERAGYLSNSGPQDKRYGRMVFDSVGRQIGCATPQRNDGKRLDLYLTGKDFSGKGDDYMRAVKDESTPRFKTAQAIAKIQADPGFLA